MNTPHAVQQTREILNRNPGLCDAVGDLIRREIEELHEQMETFDDMPRLMRTQGGIQALRQLLRAITPRDAGQRKEESWANRM